MSFDVTKWAKLGEQFVAERGARILAVTYHPLPAEQSNPYMPIDGGEVYVHYTDIPGGVIGSSAIHLLGRVPVEYRVFDDCTVRDIGDRAQRPK